MGRAVVSSVVELTLVNPMSGTTTSQFETAVRLQFVIDASLRVSDLGMFTLREDGEWELVDEELEVVGNTVGPQGQAQLIVEGTTTHFSSFAVLFSGSAGGNSDPFSGQDLVIWILSVTFFAIVIVAAVGFAITTRYVPAVRNVFLSQDNA